MNPSSNGIADGDAAVRDRPPRRRVATSVALGGFVLAAVMLADVVVTAVTGRPHHVVALVTSTRPVVCVRAEPTEPLCLNAFHTSHLRLQSVPAGDCVLLTYQGSRLQASALTGAWVTPCPASRS